MPGYQQVTRPGRVWRVCKSRPGKYVGADRSTFAITSYYGSRRDD